MHFISQGVPEEGVVLLYTHTRNYQAESKLFVVENIFECVAIELTIKNHTNVVISCIYRTPGSPIDTFCENIETNLRDVTSIKTIFVCGDFT